MNSAIAMSSRLVAMRYTFMANNSTLFQIYGVAHSYSSSPLLCALDLHSTILNHNVSDGVLGSDPRKKNLTKLSAGITCCKN